MNTLTKYLGIAAIALTLSACESTGNNEMAVPYEMERTATHISKAAPKPAPVKAPECAPTPVCETCADTSILQSRISNLQAELNQCLEKASRVEQTYREELTK